MDETTLSPRQSRIIEFIRTTVRDRGYPPTVREIGEAVGLTSFASDDDEVVHVGQAESAPAGASAG